MVWAPSARERPADHVAEGLELGADRDEDPVVLEPARVAEQLALAHRGDRALASAEPTRSERPQGLGPEDAVDREAGVALELAERRRALVAEDAVLAPGVEAERVEPVLELGDVVAAQVRAAARTGAGRRGRSRSRRARPRSRGRRSRRPGCRGPPGTRGPTSRSPARTRRLRRRSARSPAAASRCCRSRTALPALSTPQDALHPSSRLPPRWSYPPPPAVARAAWSHDHARCPGRAGVIR